MIKKNFTIIIISIVILPLFYFATYLIQNQTLKKSYVDYNEGQGADSFIRCNLNIFEPEFTDIYFTGDEGNISFKKTTRMFFQSNEEWKKSRTGGTTIKNTTFPELVEMVKEDCSQFQKAYYDESEIGYTDDMTDTEKTERWHETELKNINWSYSKAPTQDEISQDKIDFIHRAFSSLEDSVEKVFIERYGDINTMSDEDKFAIYDEVQEKGWDPLVDKARIASETRWDLSELTDKQKKKIKDRYGDWSELSDDKLLEWLDVMNQDYEKGEFSLD